MARHLTTSTFVTDSTVFRQNAASLYDFVRVLRTYVVYVFMMSKKSFCLNNKAYNCSIHFYSKLIWKTTFDGRRPSMEDDL